jgi:hypothetical protein
MSLTYSPEDHIYRYNGIIVPSVNQILDAEGILPSFDFPNAEFYRLRGEYVHDAIKMHFYGKLDEESLEGDVEAFFNGFRKFMDENPVSPEEVEKPLYSEKWGFTGTPDMWDTKAIYDWKCSKNTYAHYLLTMAGYKILIEENYKHLNYKAEKSILVHLQPNNYFIKEVVPDTNTFLGILLSYKWKEKNLGRKI